MVALLDIPAKILRKERAVGIYNPTNKRFVYENLEEIALTVQQVLVTNIPHCAFNGGNDVWVDIGNKALGISALQHYVVRLLPGDTSAEKKLFAAIAKGKEAKLRKYIAKCDPNVMNEAGNTALDLALEHRRHDVVSVLQAKEDAHLNGCSALHDASANGHVDVVRYLLLHHAAVDLKNNNGQTPLYQAAQHGKVDVVRVLLDHNAAVGAVSNNGWTALHDACANGHLDVVQVLVPFVDINVRTKDGGATALYVAAGTGQLAILKYLLDRQANPLLASKVHSFI
ncbi:hypothetical protein DYB30_001081 [Aphanomyces astaci]|uniref:Uncharacterized protein n=1 Tax=Aphanomyces astaci TaxID=112090 RepID=A0A397E7A2_APHAT|nr:hypothetical protein DYB30_001081 [Aphanomyces astaci]